MTEYNIPPSLMEEIRSLKKRVDDLERVRRPLEDPYRPVELHGHSGPLVESDSLTFSRRFAGTMTAVLARVRVPGAGDVVIEVCLNGVAVLTVTIPAGQSWVKVPCSIFCAADVDVIHNRITAAGGAEDLTLQHEFRD